MNSSLKKTFTVGFAVFAMLFGAGNLIFPPYLGMHSGTNWLWGFAGFAFMDVVLSMLVMLLVFKKSNGVDDIVGILGKTLSSILLIAMYLCIGPMVAIPRTAATTFELSVLPLIPTANSIVFSIIFFVIILVLCFSATKIVDIIGSVLAPILLITLAVLIVKGIMDPLGVAVAGDSLASTVSTGVTTGYQTMDIIAGMAFSIIIISQIKAYNLSSKKEEFRLMRYACLIAAIALVLVYGGLAYLGATVSGVYNIELSRAEIIVALAKDILGQPGLVVLAIIVAAACMTTAIGLVSSCATFFEKITNGKVSYKVWTVIMCVFSAVICNFGLDNIIALASPILGVIYPIILTLIILSVISEKVLGKGARIGCSIGTTVFVVYELIENLTGCASLTTKLPLASLGFAWVTPMIAGLIIGQVIHMVRPAK